MNILAIHDGHNATACLLKDGVIAAMVSEERFVNRKNQGGFPEQAIRWIFDTQRLTWNDCDHVVFPHLIYTHDYATGYGCSARHRLFHLAQTFVPRALLGSSAIIKPYRRFFGVFRRRMLQRYAAQHRFDPRKILQVEHHQAHGYAALLSSGLAEGNDPVLLYTLDDSGDGISSRVAVWDRDGGYRTLQEASSFHSLGHLYARVTQYLGMRPGEHEYKIMGMAPYVASDKSEHCFQKFRAYIDFDARAGRIVSRKGYGPGLLHALDRDFRHIRFDAVAAGIQRLYEHVSVAWVRHWARATGIREAVFGGGCFMNVKGNMLLSHLPELRTTFFCPSAGDESTALGAAFRVAAHRERASVAPPTSLYTGPDFTERQIEDALASQAHRVTWKRYDDIEREVAIRLAAGQIVGRFKGPAEWGARALGNRSILCRANDLRIIHRLNQSIKSRDFWMPFAASILEEDAHRYLVGSNRSALFMMCAFHTTPEARSDIAAALHPYDFTCRPQLVSRSANPDYHRLLQYFKECTGFSGVLNTSFNLHGFPVAGAPATALTILLESTLDLLALGQYLVVRK